jgi:integrase
MGNNDRIEWDRKVVGFGKRIRDGRESWIVQYRLGHKQRRMKLGEKLTLSQAREAARKILAKVELGQDPAGDKAQTRKDSKFTLGVVIADYLAVKREQVRARSFNEVARYLNDSWKPLHSTPINVIGRRDVARELGKVSGKSGATSAARARSALSAFYVWAMGEGIADANPVIGTNRPVQPKARQRTLSDSEIVSIWRTAPEHNYGRIVKLLILLGCRREEIGGLKWSELDDDKHVIHLPGERTKNHLPRDVPLSDLAWSIIPEHNDDEFVFGHERGRAGFTGWSRGKADLDQRLGESVKSWRLHDCRRFISTMLGDKFGVPPHVIQCLLGHAGHRKGVSGVYNKATYQAEVTNALMLWSDHLRALVEGGERKVLAFERGGTS